MVGKTPQVREIVYNVLDDSGERTVIAKGATTVDVGDTRELFTRTSNLEAFTTNNFSNIFWRILICAYCYLHILWII